MIKVKRTTDADLNAIQQMEQDPANRSFICPYSADRHRQIIADADSFHFKVLDREGALVGFMILARTLSEDESLELRRIVIRKKGLGYGKRCLQWVKQWCFVKQGCHRLWLDVFTDNERARHLYRSQGFVEEGTKRECIWGEDGRQSLVLMSMIKE